MCVQWGSVNLNPCWRKTTQKEKQTAIKLIEERMALTLAESSGIVGGVATEKSIHCETLWKFGVIASTVAPSDTRYQHKFECGGFAYNLQTA